MDKIRIGAVGTGHPDRFPLQKYLIIPECRVIGVAEVTEESIRNRGKALSTAAEGPPDGATLKGRVQP